MLVGLVGKPSAGKSTFFKALTLANVAIADYPFTTIKPNRGVAHVKVKCPETDFKVECSPREGFCINSNRFLPVELLDVAGLVPGAYEGKGMGNQFLDDLRQADVLVHIVDISGSLNEKGEPVGAGNYDPAEDIRFLENELDMWYYQIFQRVWRKFAYTVNQTKENVVKAITKQFSGLKVTEEQVKAGIKNLDKTIINWSDDDVKKLAVYFRKQTKPIIIAANKIDISGAEKNFEKIKKEFPDYTIIPCSAECELALKEASKHDMIDYVPGDADFRITNPEKLSHKQRKGLEFIKKNILAKYEFTGVQNVLNDAVLDVLDYIAVFPVPNSKLTDTEGRILPDCFLVPKGTTALEFAFKVHTTMGKNFIRAIDVRTKMTLKKDQELKHGDVIEIVFNK